MMDLQLVAASGKTSVSGKVTRLIDGQLRIFA